MVKIGAYQQTAGYHHSTVSKREKQQTGQAASADKAQSAGYVDQKKEATLSRGAQNVLKQLREKYGDMDFMVADFKDAAEAREVLSRGTKEFSVLFSSEELEKMASDEKYLEEKIKGMEGAVRMSEEINQKFGFERAFGKEGTAGVGIARIGIAFGDNGTTKFFAELEKSGAKQRERIEEARKEKRAAKKAEEKKAGKEFQSYSRNTADVKRTTVQADSMEELLEKIGAVDWDAVKAEQLPESGRQYDFHI